MNIDNTTSLIWYPGDMEIRVLNPQERAAVGSYVRRRNGFNNTWEHLRKKRNGGGWKAIPFERLPKELKVIALLQGIQL